jgi:hypothetical protein
MGRPMAQLVNVPVRRNARSFRPRRLPFVYLLVGHCATVARATKASPALHELGRARQLQAKRPFIAAAGQVWRRLAAQLAGRAADGLRRRRGHQPAAAGPRGRRQPALHTQLGRPSLDRHLVGDQLLSGRPIWKAVHAAARQRSRQGARPRRRRSTPRAGALRSSPPPAHAQLDRAAVPPACPFLHSRRRACACCARRSWRSASTRRRPSSRALHLRLSPSAHWPAPGAYSLSMP